VEVIAEIMDRVDWLLDESTNYDQHVNLSCRSGFDTSTYSGYARAMVVPAKIESANIGGETSLTTVANDLTAAGYGGPNRIYLVFEDFDGTAAGRVGCYGKTYACVATTDDWDSGTVGHEMLHTLGVKHSWGGEGPNGTYIPDIMISQTEDWQLDQDFNSYYDPSEPSATFNTYRRQEGDGYLNVASHPPLTTPVCCDVG
jgi:hypothetical protein